MHPGCCGADWLSTASLQGSSALGRCGPYPPLRAEMQSTIKAKGQ